MFRSTIFKAIDKLQPSRRGELEITDAIQGLIDTGLEVTSHVISGWWKDTGKPEDILEANRFVLSDIAPYNSGSLDNGVVVNGKIAVGGHTVVKSNCTLQGPLIIGGNCDIGPNTCIGPYTSIGDNVVIKGGEIENSIVLSETIIECDKRIVDSIIGKGSKIISNKHGLTKGFTLIVGENTFVSL